MSQPRKFDPRLAPLTQQLKSVAHPQPVYHQKAAEVRFERSGNVVTLYRLADIKHVSRHPAVLGNGGDGPVQGSNAPLIPLEIDGESHRAWRRVLDPMFAPKQVAVLENQVRELARQLIGGFAGAGSADLQEAYSVPLPSLTFLKLIGAPTDQLDFFLEFKDGVIHPEGDTIEEMTANMQNAAAKIYEFFVGFFADKRASTSDAPDITSALFNSTVDGRPVTDDEVLNVLFLLMFAGLDTVTSALSCSLAWLADHPRERAALVDDPTLIRAAVEELLRYESPVPSGQKFATEDIDLGDGLIIRAGEVIHVFWAAANVDPDAFPDPLTVDLTRGRTTHIAFASGTHRCLGSHLARLELRIAMEELLAAIPDFALADGGVIYDNVAVRCAQRVPVVFTPRAQ